MNLYTRQTILWFFHRQIITVKDAKRRLSLSSEDSELEDSEYQKVDDGFPVMEVQSQLLHDHHTKTVSCIII